MNRVEAPPSARRLRGLPNVNRDDCVFRLETLLRECLDPRLPSVHMHWIENDASGEGPLLALHVLQSWIGPHMVTLSHSNRFYSRNNAGKYLMDTTQLRSAFLNSESVASAARRFRAERVAAIMAGRTPVPLIPGARLCLHLVPIHAEERDFVSGSAPDVVKPMDAEGYGWSRRLNLEGSLAIGTQGPKGTLEYTLLYRNGSLEAVRAALDYATSQEIPSLKLERDIIQHAQEYVTALRRLGVESPLALFVTLLNVSNFRLGLGNNWGLPKEPPVFDRDEIGLPDLLVEGDALTELDLKPILDVLWQAAGYDKSPFFDAAGNRIER